MMFSLHIDHSRPYAMIDLGEDVAAGPGRKQL